ncbi:MAG TPA: response regulator transcription factor [Gemmatimonadales bacterium]
MSRRPRVLLADDHALIRAAFEQLLKAECDVVGTVSDGRALLDLAPKLKPDVIVADISMPLLNGLDACQQLRPRLPAVKWVFVTVNEDPDLAAEAFELGASGYLLKGSAVGELFTAIETAVRGGRHLTPLIRKRASLAAFLRQSHPHDHVLTSRQREVLQLLAEGRPMKEVAAVLGVSARTVAFHKYTIMRRLGVTSSAGLVQHAVRLGLIGP